MAEMERRYIESGLEETTEHTNRYAQAAAAYDRHFGDERFQLL
jgi:hypothetical protein